MPAKFQKMFCQVVSCSDLKDQRTNNVDPEEVAHYEPPHIDLHCL